MLSNRESARRSRRRKQQHLGELQTRVGQLQGENAALLEKLHALHVSFDDVMNRNRAMKESLAYLRAQVVSGGVVTPEVLRAAQAAVEEGDAAEAAMAAALARSGGVGVGVGAAAAAAAAAPHSRGMPHPGMPAGMYAADAGAAMHLVGGMSAASLGTHRAMVNPAGALAAPGGLGHHASWAAAVVADGVGAPRGGGPDVKPPRGLGLGGAVAMHAHAQVGAGGVVPAGVAVGVVPAGVAVTKKGRAKHTNFPLHHAAPEQLLHANAAHAGYNNARRGSSHQNQTLPPASHQGWSGRGVGGSQTSSLTRAVQNPSPERSADDPSGGSVSVGDLARGGVQGGARGARRGGGARAAGNTAAAAAVADQAAMAAQMERQRLAALGDPLGGGEEPRGGGGDDDDELGMRLMASARRGAAVQGRGLLVGHGGSPGGGDFSLPSVAGEAMAAARRAAARGLANQQGSDGSRADAGSSGPESAGNSGDDGWVLRGEGSEFRGRGDEAHGHGGSFAPQNEQSRLDDDAAAAAAAAALTADVVAGAVAGALDVTPEKMAGFEAMGAQFLAGAPGDADAQLEGLHHGVAAAPDVAALESTVDDWFNAEAGGGAEGGDKGNKMGRTESMNRVASLEHMAKRGAHERVR